MLDVLGNYVYALVDPGTKEIFYVGMASKKPNNRTNERATKHFDFDKAVTAKEKKIKSLLQHYDKFQIIHIVRHNLPDGVAVHVEAALIDALSTNTKLTNLKRGDGTKLGIKTWAQVAIEKGTDFIELDALEQFAREKNIRLTLLHIKSYREDLEAHEIYDLTRGYWRIAQKKANLDKPTIAVACVGNAIVCAYRVVSWLPAGTTFSSVFDKRQIEVLQNTGVAQEGNTLKEFIGQLATKAEFPYSQYKITLNGEPLVWPQQSIKHIE
ncbi:LEM-3-like GIY-YIG domain-containing protein [Alteromonas stellipolaris]|uniref:GIY-YIG domain-containing protein n=1 Tax=Alteromonas stellipolaris TaxID=233316 RepID=A0ABM5YQ59_9ALTE|nr:hypothetical protein AVL57_01030 [Alteromonas stellipolaris]